MKVHRARSATSRITFWAADMCMSEFRLTPGHPAWDMVNGTEGGAALIAFPRTSVSIAQQGKREVIADPTRAILYSPGQSYRRRLVSPEGDACTALGIVQEVVAEAALPFDSRAADPQTYLFPFAAAAMSTGEYELHQRIRHAVGSTDAQVFDRDVIREELYWLVARLVENGYAAHDGRRGSWSSKDVQSQVVEGVREMVGRNVAARDSLADISEKAGISPFHLARTFRARTGRSIHAYRTELRLRASLAPIADGEALADVALQLGFASQSHLTDKFRRAYGVSPNRWRASLKLSKNVEYGGAVAPVA